MLIDLFLGGSETSSTVLGWTMLFLLHKPDWQDRVAEELGRLDKIALRHYLEGRTPVTKAVLHEGLRLAAVVPMGVPKAVNSNMKFGEKVRVRWIIIFLKATADTLIGGKYLIHRGWTVMANLSLCSASHPDWARSNPENDPENFDPERFLDAEGRFENPCPRNFVPFSVGKRWKYFFHFTRTFFGKLRYVEQILHRPGPGGARAVPLSSRDTEQVFLCKFWHCFPHKYK